MEGGIFYHYTHYRVLIALVQGVGFNLVWQGSLHTAGERATAATGFAVVGFAAPVFPPGAREGPQEPGLERTCLQNACRKVCRGCTGPCKHSVSCQLRLLPQAAAAWHVCIASNLICLWRRSVVVCCVVLPLFRARDVMPSTSLCWEGHVCSKGRIGREQS
jgi:hypothetical protein